MTRHSKIKSEPPQTKKLLVEMIERGEFRVFDAAVRLVRHCQTEGCGLAAASSSANVRAVLENAGLLDVFPVAVGGDDVEIRKPNPGIFPTTASGLGHNVDECVVTDDSSLGVEAAKNGGFYCLGLLHEYHEYEITAADFYLRPSPLS